MTARWTSGGREEIDTAAMRSMSALLAQEMANAVLHSEHYWTALVMFRVTVPPAQDGSLILDHESMRAAPSIGCFICEQPYRPGLEHRRCPGDPP